MEILPKMEKKPDMGVKPDMELKPNMVMKPNMEKRLKTDRRPKVSLSMVYDSPRGCVKRRDSGTGAVSLITRESGEVLILCYGNYSELQALCVLLELCRKSFDALDSRYIRALLVTGLEDFTGMAHETVGTMRARLDEKAARPCPVSPRA